MKRKFLKDFIVDDDVVSVELLESKLEINDKGVNLINEMLIKKSDAVENVQYLISLNDVASDIENLDIEVEMINCVKTCSRVTIFGDLKVKNRNKEKIDFQMNPFKEELMKGFISFKRDDVEVISTLDEDSTFKEKDEYEIINLEVNEEGEVKEENEVKKEEIPSFKKEELIKDEYTSPLFYYRIKDNENIGEILRRFNITEEEFRKFNKQKEYHTNSLIRIKRYEK